MTVRSTNVWTHYVRYGFPLLVAITMTAISTRVSSHVGTIEIVTPGRGVLLESLPVGISVRFSADVRTDTFEATLNGRDVSAQFAVTPNGATASLTLSDGVRPSLGRNGQNNAPNTLIVHVRSQSNVRYNANQTFFLRASSTEPQASDFVPPEGGTVSLPGYGSMVFGAGAFSAGENVTISATSRPETAAEFQTTAEIFSAGPRVPYEIRVTAGQRPQSLAQANLVIPSAFLAQVPANAELHLFAQIFQDGGDEVLDSFELLPSTVSQTNEAITVTLPPEAFTSRRRVDGVFEAILVIGTAPTRPVQTIAGMLGSLIASPFVTLEAQSTCNGATLGQPLDSLTRTSRFNGTTHFGTDYAANGDTVMSMADGVVERIGFDERPLPVPDPRSGKMVKGWGHYVVVKHTDGSKTLYAHLEPPTITAGTNVIQGQQIAISDNSGGSSGPHLHVEYAPNGAIYQRASKVDPEPCIGGNVTGSITVFDNGSAADDAFSVAINGVVVCQTSIGASNTCAVGSLRPGTATLTITAVIAPDNVGTFQINLASGLTFAGGGASVSGILPQGGSTAFTINIPRTSP